MKDSIETFLSSLDINLCSKHSYRKNITRFFAWISNQKILAPLREDILAYKSCLKAQGLSPSTISAYIVVIKRFFEWTEFTGHYPNIAKGIKGAKRSRGTKKDPLNITQINTLLASIDRTNIIGKRDFALLNLLIRTGLRAVEVTRANIDDIRQEAGQCVLWIQGKGRDEKDDFVVLTEQTLAPLQDYLDAHKSNGDERSLFASHGPRNKEGRLTVE